MKGKKSSELCTLIRESLISGIIPANISDHYVKYCVDMHRLEKKRAPPMETITPASIPVDSLGTVKVQTVFAGFGVIANLC